RMVVSMCGVPAIGNDRDRARGSRPCPADGRCPRRVRGRSPWNPQLPHATPRVRASWSSLMSTDDRRGEQPVSEMDLNHLRRESRTALELAIVELAPTDLIDRLAVVTGLLEA